MTYDNNSIIAFWHIVEADIYNGVKEFFGSRRLLKELNSTFIVLIPKIPRADSLNKFKPISLCNSVDKILSKVLTSRLLEILPRIISFQQNGFVPGRQILDSIISVHENIHSLKVVNNQGFFLKLDMAKAFDRVNWQFLLRIMKAFGFGDKFIQLCSQLMETSSSTVIVNGSPSSFFKISRGLRQGDPISPIPSSILAECLGRFIFKNVEDGNLKGLKPSSSNVVYSHEQFIDDFITMGEATIMEAKNMKIILNTYESAFGQKINQDKSCLFFINTPAQRQIRIGRILGCNITEFPSTYLGLPLYLKPEDSFQNKLTDRINLKLAGSKGVVLSQAGKITLLKATLQNLLVYALSLFKIPSKFAKAIEKIQKKFLWS